VKLKRTQIYITSVQDAKLAKRAAGRRTTKSTLIREAIDAFLSKSQSGDSRLVRFRAAVDELRRHPPLELPSGEAYLEELRAFDVQRQEELERLRQAK
jgi:Ribbon-helix-helix protein, copG family